MSSSGVTDPNHLTVDKLKRELSERNVPLPKFLKKDDLVELYKRNVLVSARKPSGVRIAYSDDDELIEKATSRKSVGNVAKRRSMTTRTKDESVVSSSGVNVSNMTDAELVENLLRCGADVGPVTDSTRSVYEKKLVRLLDDKGKRDRIHHISPIKKFPQHQQRKPLTHYSDEEEEANEEEEDEIEEEDQEDGSRNGNFEETRQQSFKRYGVNSYEQTASVQRQFATSDEKYDLPDFRRSMEFAARPPLSSFGAFEESFSRQPLSSGLTTRRSHVYSSADYTSYPRSTYGLRDSSLSAASSKVNSHVQQANKATGSKTKRCFWLLLLFLLLGFLVSVVAVWAMDPEFRNLAWG